MGSVLDKCNIKFNLIGKALDWRMQTNLLKRSDRANAFEAG